MSKPGMSKPALDALVEGILKGTEKRPPKISLLPYAQQRAIREAEREFESAQWRAKCQATDLMLKWFAVKKEGGK